MKNCMIAQSGGPTAAINASLEGVIRQNQTAGCYDTVYGALNGITGILNERILDLSEAAEEKDFLRRLRFTPAMYLGSCRYKLPKVEENRKEYEKIFAVFEKYEIDTFFYIGGNDSMDTVLKLSAYAKSVGSGIKVLGIPKTIDNDLLHTDHTPGFGSAAKYVAASMLEIAHDTLIYHIKSVTIVEIMGRDAGWLTAASALARNDYNNAPHLIYLPEHPFDIETFMKDTTQLLEKQDSVVIAVSEGIRDRDGNYISSSVSTSDNFGHTQLSGAGKALELLLRDRFDFKVRSVEVNILQRCAGHIASETDLSEAEHLGMHGVKLAQEGVTGHMITTTRTADDPYEITYGSCPIDRIANGVKNVPRDFINEAGNDVTEKMITYLKPLILGEPAVTYTDGMPDYLPVDHLYKRS